MYPVDFAVILDGCIIKFFIYIPGWRPGQVTVCWGLEQVTFTPCLVLVKPVEVRLTWTDCDEAGDYVVPNVLSPRDLVSRPDSMDRTLLHTYLKLQTVESLCS